MNCIGCGKEWKDDAERMVYLNRFVRSRRERACFDYSCRNCGTAKALREREYQDNRFDDGDGAAAPDSVGPFRFSTGGGTRNIRSGKEMS
jgi:hypothetical protein